MLNFLDFISSNINENLGDSFEEEIYYVQEGTWSSKTESNLDDSHI